MENFVVVLASEELGTWPKRLLGLHAYNNLELEGTTEATYTLHPTPTSQTDAETPEPRGVKQLTQGLRMNL